MEAISTIGRMTAQLDERMRKVEFAHLVTHGERIAMPHVLKPTRLSLAIWEALGAVPREVMLALHDNQRQIVMATAAMRDFNVKQIVVAR